MENNCIWILFLILLLLPNFSQSCSSASDCYTAEVCKGGTCQDCSSNADCTAPNQSPKRVLCNSSGKCVQCLSNSDCPSETTCQSDYPYLCGSNNGCTSNSQCPTARPYCVDKSVGGGSGKSCNACDMDRDCNFFNSDPLLKYCVEGICRSCRDNSDCPLVTASACVSGSCTTCTTHSDCSHLTGTEKCSTALGKCAQCAESSDCPSISFSKCSATGTCIKCTGHPDCTHFSATREIKCSTSLNKCVQCLGNSDCNLVSASKCITGTGTCTACTTDDDCAQFSDTGETKCSPSLQKCVRCLGNNECTLVTASKCSGGSCIKCSDNNDCTQFTGTGETKCSTSLNKCVRCLVHSDCPLVTASRCLSMTGTCTACSSSTDCAHFTGTGETKCSTFLNKCVRCLVNSDCPLVTASKCSSTTGTCEKCTGDPDCAHLTASGTTKCSTSLDKCVQCLANSDCISASASKCDSTTGSCIACTTNTDCQQFTATGTTKCSIALSKCVSCLADTDCPSVSAPKCSPTTGTCVSCSVDDDCHSALTPFCATTISQCVECLLNSHCNNSVSASKCLVSGFCVSCTSNSDCEQFSTTKLCSTSLEKCVQCLVNNDCNSISASKCDSTTGSCIACATNTDCEQFTATGTTLCSTTLNQCVHCLTNSDCTSVSASKCSATGSCTTCQTSTDCQQFTATGTTLCSPTLNQCVQCLANSDCTSVSASRCWGTGICTKCTTNTDCMHFSVTGTTLCSTTLHKCVECLTNNDCTSVSASKCDSMTGSCTTCAANTDCERFTSTTPFCSITLSECVACLVDTDCPSAAASKCSPTTGTCTTCSVDAECHFELTPFCSTALSQCVECLSNTDCTSASSSKCSMATGSCIACNSNDDCTHLNTTNLCSTALSKCVECLTNTDCTSASASKCSSSGDCTVCTQDSDCHFTETPACSSSGGCVSVCTKNHTQCTSCSDGLYLLNDTCLPTCPFGYIANSKTNTCDETSNAELIATVESMADASSTSASIASAAMIGNALKGAGGANLLGSAFGAQMVIFCKFMNITYPDHVMVFFNSSNPISLSIPIDLQIFTSDYYPEDSEINQINDNGNLEYFEVSQYVYDNVLDQVATLLLTIIVTGLVYAAANFRCFQRAYSERAKNIIKQADILISNFVIMAVFSNTLEVVFYSLLNLYYPTIYTRFGWMNFVSSIVFVILILIYFVWSIIKLRKIYLLKRGTQSKPSIHLTSKDRTSGDNISSSKLENSFVKERSENHDLKNDEVNDEVIDEFSEMPKVKCLHEEYKSDSLVQQMYIPVTFVRAFLFSLNLVIFPDSPQWQSIAALTIHCCYFAYMVILRPVKNKFEFIMGIFFEISVIGVTTCVVGLAVVTKRDDFLDHLDLWNNFGWAIVGFNFMLIGGSLILTIASVFQTAIQVYQLIKLFIEKRKRKRLQKAAIEFSPQQDSFTNKDLDRQDSIQLAPFDLSNANSDNILNDTINQSTFIKSSPIPPLQQYLNNKGSIIQSNERPSRTTISWVMGQDLKTTFEKIDGKPLSSSPVSISPTPTNQPSEQMSHQAALEDGTSLSKKSSFFGESPNKKKKTEKFTSGIRPPEVILQSFVKSRNKDFFSTTK